MTSPAFSVQASNRDNWDHIGLALGHRTRSTFLPSAPYAQPPWPFPQSGHSWLANPTLTPLVLFSVKQPFQVSGTPLHCRQDLTALPSLHQLRTQKDVFVCRRVEP